MSCGPMLLSGVKVNVGDCFMRAVDSGTDLWHGNMRFRNALVAVVVLQ